ncbi:MAG: hypothetical protein L0Y72_23540 [Gemmataceae bacterium]|nr:hypothetical protein [Gemmataceae bacterium]MCI0742018.1 hypothetical protein [Gemmataceae bacterium]
MIERLWIWTVLLVGGAGCANIDVRKVPVDKRIADQDYKIRGFRYYLSRPYIVIKEKIPLGAIEEEVRLVEVKAGEYLLQSLTSKSNGHFKLYKLDGSERPNGVKVQPVQVVPKQETKTPKGTNGNKKSEEKSEKKKLPVKPGDPEVLDPIILKLGGPKIPERPGMTEITKPTLNGGAADDAADLALLKKRIQVVMLPDFEEQYAVQNRNFAAKGEYDLAFADGWQLDSVAGSWNSTEVPIKALVTLQGFITNFVKLKKAALGVKSLEVTPPTLGTRLFLTRSFYIEPGIYRLQKSWERVAAVNGDTSSEHANGLLSELGLTIAEELSVKSK